jgi:hypothetical protein
VGVAEVIVHHRAGMARDAMAEVPVDLAQVDRLKATVLVVAADRVAMATVLKAAPVVRRVDFGAMTVAAIAATARRARPRRRCPSST